MHKDYKVKRAQKNALAYHKQVGMHYIEKEAAMKKKLQEEKKNDQLRKG